MEIAAFAAMPDFSEQGFEYLHDAVADDTRLAMAEITANIASDAGGRRWAGAELEALVALPMMSPVLRLINGHCPQAHILRMVAFKKDERANWFVPAHQDRSIPVPGANPLPGFSRVTRKGDGWQAEAPLELLQTMRNFRIFIDAATADDGPLEVIPGSHRLGRIEQAMIAAITEQTTWQPLTGGAGDVIVLSPMLLHRSSRARRPRGRRVLQVECVSEAAVATYSLVGIKPA